MPFRVCTAGVPRIDQPQSEIATQWNAQDGASDGRGCPKQVFLVQRRRRRGKRRRFLWIFDIQAATPDLISVRVSHAEVCDDGPLFFRRTKT